MSFSRMAAKQSPPCSRMRSGKRGDVGLELQVVARHRDDLRQIVQRQHAVERPRCGCRRHAELAGDEVAQRLRHRRIELEADHRAAPAPLQRALEEAHQVLGLFLDLDVAVADDAEGARRP